MTAFRFAARSIHAEIQLLGRRNKFVSPFDTRREYFPIPSPSLTFNYRQSLNLFPGLDNTGRISPNPRITRLAIREAEIYERKRDRVDEFYVRVENFYEFLLLCLLEGMLARVGNDLVPNCFPIRYTSKRLCRRGGPFNRAPNSRELCSHCRSPPERIFLSSSQIPSTILSYL